MGWRFFLALLTAVVGEVDIVWSEDRLSDGVAADTRRGVQGGAQLKHAADGFYHGRANMRVPCKVEWEAMDMSERRTWIIDE